MIITTKVDKRDGSGWTKRMGKRSKSREIQRENDAQMIFARVGMPF